MKKSILLTFLTLIFTLHLTASEKPIDAKSFSFSTFNIRNYGASSDPSMTLTDNLKLKDLLLRTDSDIIGVQEVVNDNNFKSFIKKNLPAYDVKLSECGGRGRQKLGFIYKREAIELLNFTEDQIMNDSGQCHNGLRPAVIANFKNRSTSLVFTAINLHLKAGGRQSHADKRLWQYRRMSRLIKKLRESGNEHLVIVGDFNTTDYLLKNNNYRRFIDFVEHNDFVDMAESLECTSYWFGGVDNNYFSPSLLDHILISRSLWRSYRTRQAKVGSHCKKVRCDESHEDTLGESFKNVSDHCPVSATLK